MTAQLAMSSPEVSARPTCGSRMPSGRSPRIWVIASRMSLTARSIGVPRSSWTTVCELPSLTLELISSMPSIERTAASTRWVTWVSISVGAAPGCEMLIQTIGKSMSGSFWTCIRMKLTRPASSSAANRTSDGTGLRIDQAEMLRKLMASIGSYRRRARPLRAGPAGPG